MRIITGQFGGRRLNVPKGQTTRPTSDRAREAIFSHLVNAIVGPLDGVRVLDLFAGSGALALEALSRGAVHASLVEQDRNALTVIQQNIASLGVEAQTSLVRGSLPNALRRLEGTFGVVFADPPYQWQKLPALADTLAEMNLVDDNSVLVFEHATASKPMWGAQWTVRSTRAMGDTTFSVLQRASA